MDGLRPLLPSSFVVVVVVDCCWEEGGGEWGVMGWESSSTGGCVGWGGVEVETKAEVEVVR